MNKTSEFLSGVPKGLVLGLIMIILTYINDPEMSLTSKVSEFEDDKIFRRGMIPGNDLNKLSTSFEKWQIKLDFAKYKIMHFGEKDNKCEYGMFG